VQKIFDHLIASGVPRHTAKMMLFVLANGRGPL